jgi:hypothetical protein
VAYKHKKGKRRLTIGRQAFAKVEPTQDTKAHANDDINEGRQGDTGEERPLLKREAVDQGVLHDRPTQEKYEPKDEKTSHKMLDLAADGKITLESA